MITLHPDDAIMCYVKKIENKKKKTINSNKSENNIENVDQQNENEEIIEVKEIKELDYCQMINR